MPRVLPVLLLAAALSACLSPETKAKLGTLEAENKAATATAAASKSEVDLLLEKLKTATGDDLARLEAERVAAAAALEAARAKQTEAEKILLAAQAEANAERFRNGVDIASGIHGAASPILGMILPALAPILGFLGIAINSMKKGGSAVA